MIENGNHINTGQSAQVCIVGSGAAGISLAWELDRQGIQVLLIDGSRDLGDWTTPYNPPYPTDRFYEDKKLLYSGKVSGLFTHNEPNFLILPTSDQTSPSERERYFGGTTNHFGGQSRPLDPLTFAGYGNYPAWPVSSEELAPYYKRAATLVNLAADDFSAAYWANEFGDEVPDLPGFETAMYQFIGSDYLLFAKNGYDASERRFSATGQTLANSKIRVIRNASLLNVEQQGGSVRRITVGSIGETPGDGKPPGQATQFTIEADAFVLACGAVENAHQLLISDVANSSGLVGRYFMCQPLISNTVFFSGAYLNSKQDNLMNGKLANGSPYRSPEGVSVTGRFQPSAAVRKEQGIGSCWFWSEYSSYYFEQASNYDSHVSFLPGDKDPVFNLPKTSINWAFNDLDKNTYTTSTKLFKEAVEASAAKNGLNGSVSFQSWDYIEQNAVVNGHHLGTTRMSSNPKEGVVDQNLCAHDLDNLYMAGSSVWTSAGVSNPTFSIVMFSLRLADHLAGKLKAKS